ncbi:MULTISPECIES: glycine zipper 2TM domain-containing protein [Novosphingobium]|uniref:17 kDa surface antigen n=1 Tax=Novosphingobium mathurense TaxID=428990 RepID=A0A1U6GRV3_9SPHN|nr:MULTISPECIES: glycine zipper 2TM domain-containing protein [Novosphingobium]CDO36935.1 17 kDa surface antigen [Novosphingobium sp. KN65.2]SLJ86261.1 Glycine zipper 2TM domain-containing protein [Novosphingobium mathurense]
MFKRSILAITAAALAIPAVPAAADPPPWAPAHGYREKERHHRIYDSRGRYYEPRRISRHDRVWRGRDGRYYCRRDNGTTGLIIGAGVGALAGHELAGNGDKTLGAILGGVAGGLLGRTIDRGDLKCR